ncbi:transposase [Brevibacillus fluminis]|uniref:Transposase n=1 Tax=Brevibacillus fluminis TaxID=511487 RepID=A0A3M8CV97_9BACL|nr:Mu transposase C-terminal domain-containing protein [Brevibacillus fluminis]RNB79752.1 transposase [Brevibacillus fluminis]
MHPKLAVNMIIVRRTHEDVLCKERILYIDTNTDTMYLIDIDMRLAFPYQRKVSDVLNELQCGICVVQDNDPKAIVISEADIPQLYKDKRDNAWGLIKAAVKDEPDIYIEDSRGKIIKILMKQNKISKVTLYKYFRKYWQRGKSPNSLLPNYQNCGVRERTLVGKKTGRPSRFREKIGDGANVTEEMKKIFRIAVARFYMNKTKNSLSYTYTQMLKEYFYDEETIPTLRQFRYWFNKEIKRKDKIIAREGKKKYNLGSRPVLSNSHEQLIGPGSVYQIDATIADVYIVSRYNRTQTIGRPTLYFVVDVFSRMITGVYVGLENPSWNAAMMALANAFSNKVEFCKQLGIDITEDMWNAQYLPDTIVADRGEMLSGFADTLANSLQIRVVNTPAYRPDLKGIVERTIRTVQELLKPFLAGYVHKDAGERGVTDYRKEAKLDLYQFTRMVIYAVLYLNNDKEMKKYPLSKEMIADGVEPLPRQIWEWGLQNRSGSLRACSEELVKLNLMPRGKATITFQGIIFKGKSYSCQEGIEEGWFERANKNSWREEVAYDPRNAKNIYLIRNNGRDFITCSLLPKEKEHFEMTFDEILHLNECLELNSQLRKNAQLQHKIDFFKRMEEIRDEAESESPKEKVKTKNIKAFRKVDKEKNREKEALHLNRQKTESEKKGGVLKADNVTSIKDETEVSVMDLIRSKQKENWSFD